MNSETEAARAKVRAQQAARAARESGSPQGGLPQSPAEWREHDKQNREAREKEERTRRQAAAKEAAKANWIRTGGLEKEFEQAYAEIHREQNKTRLLEAENRAKAAQAANLRDSF